MAEVEVSVTSASVAGVSERTSRVVCDKFALHSSKALCEIRRLGDSMRALCSGAGQSDVVVPV
jgi:hypothetical protein